MTVRLITPADTLPLRQLVLRPGGRAADCIWPGDEAPGAFHLGSFLDDQLISIGSFQPGGHPHLSAHRPYRLRGMATHPNARGKGAGRALLHFALDHLRGLGADLLWCNARCGAVPFYALLGFTVTGPVFDMAGIGPHQVMWRRV